MHIVHVYQYKPTNESLTAWRHVQYMYMYMYMRCCFALFVCLILLASFFLPSHLSFKNMHTMFFLFCFNSLGLPFAGPDPVHVSPGQSRHVDSVYMYMYNMYTIIITVHVCCECTYIYMYMYMYMYQAVYLRPSVS